jgi:hypothetical protein
MWGNSVRPAKSCFALFVFELELWAVVVDEFIQHFTYSLSEIYTGWRFVDVFFTIQQQQKSFQVHAYRMGV